MGKSIATINVELRDTESGKVVAQASDPERAMPAVLAVLSTCITLSDAGGCACSWPYGGDTVRPAS